MTDDLLRLSALGLTYANGTRALDGVDLSVGQGEFLSLLGPSGCGKSSILRLVAGLMAPTDGRVDWVRPLARGDIGFVFQEPTLMPWARILDNVRLPLDLAGVPRAEGNERAADGLARVGLADFRTMFPRELSGGMKMRAALARALVTHPRLLLLDEPFAALDEITRLKLNDDLLTLWETQRFTAIFVTHSVFESVYLSSRIAIMGPRPGRVVQEIPVDLPWPRDLSVRTGGRIRRAVPGRVRPAAPGHGGGGMSGHWARRLLPPLVGLIFLCLWEGAVRLWQIPVFVLPPPHLVAVTLWNDAPLLLQSAWLTLLVTVQAFVLALVTGVGLAVLFNQSRALEAALYPYAIILQVTPIVAIAPLVVIWVGYERVDVALLILAWIVAFFPILSNSTAGLSAVDPHLRDLFRLYGAGRWQTLWRLKLPSALPFILAGAKISGGLALIGAVVAEFVAGSGTATGLAWRVIEAGNRLNMPRLFAALTLLSALGILIFAALSWVQRLLLRRWQPDAGV